MTNSCNCPNGSYGQKHTAKCYEDQIARLDADAAGVQAELASVKACWAEALENYAKIRREKNTEIERLTRENAELRATGDARAQVAIATENELIRTRAQLRALEPGCAHSSINEVTGLCDSCGLRAFTTPPWPALCNCGEFCNQSIGSPFTGQCRRESNGLPVKSAPETDGVLTIQDGVLTITRNVTTVSPNFRVTATVSEPNPAPFDAQGSAICAAADPYCPCLCHQRDGKKSKTDCSMAAIDKKIKDPACLQRALERVEFGKKLEKLTPHDLVEYALAHLVTDLRLDEDAIIAELCSRIWPGWEQAPIVGEDAEKSEGDQCSVVPLILTEGHRPGCICCACERTRAELRTNDAL